MNNMCIVIPAQAGIHDDMLIFWIPAEVYPFEIPASAGMTKGTRMTKEVVMAQD
ncbi:MAG: hypothetical protein KAV45_07935 [Calditrichia bacterium]|jgi:hypothetical protein|nr:hypothetical protein [Calditrichia bacterium]